ncbi:GNAT family N-acetyltransferase [Spirochaeta lutea]|uniref:GNAT family N-acetyltransferase n=1 Tax=Spirochaeta lutea TaxID=1480694 RepID=UPI0009DD513F
MKHSTLCDNRLSIHNLHGVDYQTLAQYFNEIFEGYMLPVSMTEKSIRNFCRRRRVDLDHSYILPTGSRYDQHHPVGIILNGFSPDKKEVYNAGMAIRPGFRGKGLGKNMFEAVIRVLADNGCRHYSLEVIDTNTSALNLYSTLGFQKKRHFSVAIAPYYGETGKPIESDIVPQSEVRCETIPMGIIPPPYSLSGWDPSWQNSYFAYEEIQSETTCYSLVDTHTSNTRATVITDNAGGVIHGWFSEQLSPYELSTFVRSIGESSTVHHFSWTNILSDSWECRLLRALDFQIPISQWEMHLDL